MSLGLCRKRILAIIALFNVLLYVALILGFTLPFWSSVDIFESNTFDRNAVSNHSLGSNINVTFVGSIVSNSSYQKKTSRKTEVIVGLFTLCHKLEDYYCCGNRQDLDTAFKNADWITLIATLLGIALISGLIPMLPCYCKSRLSISYAFINFITSVLVLVSCALFTVNHMDMSKEHKVMFSFIITTFAGSGYLIVTLVPIAMYRKDRSSSDNDHEVNPSSCKHLCSACSSDSDADVNPRSHPHSSSEDNYKWTVVFHCTLLSMFLLQEVNFMLPFWTSYNRTGDDLFQGVLVKCFWREPLTCCGFNDDAFSPNSEMPFVFPLLLGLQITSFATGIVGIILINRWLCKKTTTLRTFLAVLLSFVNCAVLLSFCAVYGETIHNPNKSEKVGFGSSFYISIFLVMYHLVVAIIITCGKQCGGKCISFKDTCVKWREGISRSSSTVGGDTETLEMSQLDNRLGHTNQGYDAVINVPQAELRVQERRNIENETQIYSVTPAVVILALSADADPDMLRFQDNIPGDVEISDGLSIPNSILMDQGCSHDACSDMGSMTALSCNARTTEQMETVTTKVLDCTSEDYQHVEQRFLGSIGTTKYKIIEIQSIHNKELHEMYTTKLKNMDCERQKERELWHGTSAETVPKINQRGFNRSFCGKNATVLGKGVYFAEHASYSACDTYSKPDEKGQKRMYLCKVLTGDYCKGRGSMVVPDTKCDDIISNSAVNDLENPSVFVVFGDYEAYPKYLIIFKEF